MHIGFWLEEQEEGDKQGDLKINEEVIKMDRTEKGWGDVDSIDLAQDTEPWRVVVKMVVKLLRIG
jgi:hypothetical protein